MIRALLADSSPTDIDMLTAILSADPEIEVIGIAKTGKQAVDLVSRLKPDIVTISESLQDKDGSSALGAIRQIMAYNPTPILILTDPNCEGKAYAGGSNVFKAISMGALDVIEKPISEGQRTKSRERRAESEEQEKPYARELIEAVKLLSKIKVVTHLAGKLEDNRRHSIPPAYAGGTRYPMFDKTSVEHQASSIKLVAIAASTGGPSALVEVLQGLPAELGIGVVIVQHVAEGFSAGLAEWLDRESEITVKEAENGDRIRPGRAFLAPTGFHMVVKAYAGGNRIMLNKMPPVSGHRPSADVLFTSVAGTYGCDSIGVILTGMGSDGARGIAAIKKAGGRTMAQDEQSSALFGMPKAAIQTGVVDEVIPLNSIAERIVRICSENRKQPVARDE